MKKLSLKKPSRKLVIIISSVVAVSILSVAGIAAYLTHGDQANNQITIGSNRITVVEDFQPPKELTPGVSFTKDVTVDNTGSVDCFVRVMAVYSDSDMGKYCTVDWNETDWVYNSEDNYWYYKHPIKAEESTASLFTTVTLSEEIDPAVIKDFDIIVYAESYQAYGYSDYASAWADYKANKP